MIKPPRFWQNPKQHVLPFLLSPLSKIVAAYAARRACQKGWVAPVPVICCGNLTTGGTGKTTVVLDLMACLQAQGISVHALIRGYKGCITGPSQVDLQKHTVRDVGDEALLLASCGPTWVGADRAASAQKAVQAGAQCLIMDDGFQNPTLFKTFSFLIIDGGVGLGNGHVLPAGPLREAALQGLQRADAVLVIGKDQTGFAAQYAASLKGALSLQAYLKTEMPTSKQGEGLPYVAFAGLGRPEKFFDGLKQAQVNVVKTFSFPDHYFYKQADLDKLKACALACNAQLLTTPKDATRLPAAFRQHVTIANVSLIWSDEQKVTALLHTLMAGKVA